MAGRPPLVRQPFSRCEIVDRSTTGFRTASGNIAAIDFGTTSLSIAYTTIGSKSVSEAGDVKIPQLMKLGAKQETRVPNAIIFRKGGDGTVMVEDIGDAAQQAYQSARAKQLVDTFIFFERIKMSLKNSVSRDTVTVASNGNQYYLVEVIAFTLKFLRDKLINHLSKTIFAFKTTDFDWVITVPAIWDARGKRMMREAAYMAGLLSETESITRFTPVGDGVPRPSEDNPDKLSLALEPESAAIYSQYMTSQQVSVVDDEKYLKCKLPSRYMVIDAGGGTIDITVHYEVAGSIEVVNTPSGNAWGGTQVNQQFSELLQDIVGDSEFKNFLSSGSEADKLKKFATLTKIVHMEFEQQKVTFGDKCSEKCLPDTEISVGLDKRFVQFYGDASIAEGAKRLGIDYEDNSLFIKYSMVKDRLMGRVVDEILSCTRIALDKCNADIEAIYLVGGFGGCNYIFSKVDEEIKRMYPHKSIRTVLPINPNLAIAAGAVMWRENPDMIKGRKVNATYGVGASIRFEEGRHDFSKAYLNADNVYRVDVLKTFLQQGEMAWNGKVFTSKMTPSSNDLQEVEIEIYSTQSDAQYLTRDIQQIGKLVIDVPNPDNLPRHKRIVEYTIDFSGTEIQAKACYLDKEVKTVCDFL